jgi:hypothetical protein
MKKIYESPDGGQTIYVRDLFTNEKTMLHCNKVFSWNEYLNQVNWDFLVEHSSAVKDALEQLKILAELCKK